MIYLHPSVIARGLVSQVEQNLGRKTMITTSLKLLLVKE